jgi:HAD superfamily hydrolase (TIGR01509 family)
LNGALIFDCDGVLADTERDGHLVAFNRLFTELGLDLQWSPARYAGLLRITGGKERLLALFADPAWVARHGLPEDRASQEELVAGWHRRKTAIFLELAAAGALPARPGVARLAAEAQAAGWQTAVASTAADLSVRAIVDHVFPPGVAAAVRVFAGDIVERKKPAPDIYSRAFSELGRTGAECCVVEDSRQGLLAARAAGGAVIITPCEFTASDDFSGAALVVDCLGDEGHPLRVLASRLPGSPGPTVTVATCVAVREAAGKTAPRKGGGR